MKKSKKSDAPKRKRPPAAKSKEQSEATITLPAGPIRELLFALLDNPRFVIGVGLAMLGGAIIAGKVLKRPKEEFDI